MDVTAKLVAPLGACALGLGSYYLVRPLANPWVRGVLASVTSAALTAYVCKDLRSGMMGTMISTSLCWMSSIRLTSLMLLPDEERHALTLRDFAARFLWFVFPVSENPLPREGWAWLKHVGYHAGLCLGKLVASNWVHRWLTYGLSH